MLKWDKLLSEQRFGENPEPQPSSGYFRSQFQRDYDRIIFSSPFRRLQNKTQVFPLPGSIFVHNRLTHSLEVASVGRSLGNIIAAGLRERRIMADEHYLAEIGGIVSAACLAHDMGNPPFGHSGENAISSYFQSEAPDIVRSELHPDQLADFVNFEGNANALRLLTHQFTGRRKGGFALTYSTLATIMKYPTDAASLRDGISPYEKYGMFQSETATGVHIMEQLGLRRLHADRTIFCRHPLVFLMEAADDICYQVVDIEDAHKLNILSTAQAKELLLAFFDPQEDKKQRDSLLSTLSRIPDENEQMNILRSRVINRLIEACTQVFWEQYAGIMAGEHFTPLTYGLGGAQKDAMADVKTVAASKVYVARSVVEIQVAGHHILNELLDVFVNAVINPHKLQSKQILQLLPSQLICHDQQLYHKLQSAVDFISGMTDVYALELYRKIKGISFDIVR